MAKILTTIPLTIRGGDGTASILKMVLSTEPEQEAVFQDELVIYADEQGASYRKGGPDFAVGLEFGPTPVDSAVIQDALNRRSCDVAAGSRCKDQRTQLRRTYFHAAEDCRNCTTILADAIENRLRERFFLSLRWHFSQARPDHPEGAELHQHMIALLLGLVSTATGVQRIVFKFEHAQGILASAIKKWLDEDITIRINAMIRIGVLPIFAPIVVEEVGKMEHGIQVCDHLLWRENRELKGKPERLEDVGMVFNQSQEHAAFKISVYQHGDVTLPLHDRLPEPRDPGDVPWAQVVEMLYQIEATIHDLARAKRPELAHLDSILTSASARARGRTRISFDDFVQLHVAFLTIVRLYARQTEVSDELRQRASDLARLSIIIAQRREVRALSMFSTWLATRERLVTCEGSLLA